jgi:protein gp37
MWEGGKMSKSSIEWTTDTWNPTTGCTHVSAGCDHCYAERLATRLQATGAPKYRQGFRYTEHAGALDLPRRWKGSRLIFVNSMSDLFHEDATQQFIGRVFATMMETPQHTYQVLTKRPNKAAVWLRAICEKSSIDCLPSHIWLGTSVENIDVLWRIEHLRGVPAAVRFLSCEPLLGPLGTVDLAGIDWVIAGGESGPGARPMHLDWARELRDRCLHAGVAFFLKQLGGWPGKRGGEQALLDGQLWRMMPVVNTSANAPLFVDARSA